MLCHTLCASARPTRTSKSIAGSIGDTLQAVLSYAFVGAAKATGQTDWIVQYREDFRRSIVSFQKAIELDPKYAAAYHALSQSLRYLGRAEEAARMARRAAELEPDRPEYSSRAEAILADISRAPAQTGVNSGGMTWNDVVLPDRTKRELKQMQLLLEDPSLSGDLGIEPPSGLLLYGPPGTGKTTIARVLADEAKCRFFASTPAEINSMWMGESEKHVARLFASPRAHAPSIVFLDEIDALLPYRSGGINVHSDKVVNQFLHEMDGLTRNRRVFVVGATNRKDMLDPALLRGGRLSREIEIPLPDQKARLALFMLSTRGARLSAEVSLEDLATKTAGYSGANIKALVNEAGLQALIRLSESEKGTERELTRQDFEEALANFTPNDTDPSPPPPFRLFG